MVVKHIPVPRNEITNACCGPSDDCLDAQGWREYEYPNEGFTVAFPAEPRVETTSYQASGGRLVEARVYSAVQEGGEFKVTVADLSHTEMSEGNVMAYAVLMLSRGVR